MCAYFPGMLYGIILSLLLENPVKFLRWCWVPFRIFMFTIFSQVYFDIKEQRSYKA